MNCVVRPFAAADKEWVNARARAAPAQYEEAYHDWRRVLQGAGRSLLPFSRWLG